MKYKFKGVEFLEDIIDTGITGMNTVGFTLSFLGLQYINEKYYGGTLPAPPLPGDTLILSKEFGFYAAEMACVCGTLFEGVRFAYNALKVPAKIVSGKYISRNKKD